MPRLKLPIEILVAFLLTLFSLGGTERALGTVCTETVATEETVEVKLPYNEIYSEGEARGGHFVFLTKAKYVQLASKELINSDAIIVLEDLSLAVDLPVVKGVVLSKPLKSHETHVEVLARKMKIPMVLVDRAYERWPAQIDQRLSYDLKLLRENQVLITESKEPDRKVEKSKTLLPRKVDRRPLQVIDSSQAELYPIEISGQKFRPLAELRESISRENTPDIFSASPGFFEAFLDKFTYQGIKLRIIIRDYRKLISETKDENRIRHLLGLIRKAMQEAKLAPGATNPFQKLSDELAQYIDNHSKISVRSNNEIEDLIGAGVFASSVAKSILPEHIEAAARKVFVSMYTFRSFMIRRRWQLPESRLSMPLLIHKYIGQEQFNGLGKFTINRKGELELKVDLVLGSESRATNPEENKDGHGTFVLDPKTQQVRLVEGSDLLKSVNLEPINELMRTMDEPVRRSIQESKYSPESLDIEFIAVEKFNGFSFDLIPIVLQYKYSYPREVVLATLRGEIEFDRLFEKIDSHRSIEGSVFDRFQARLNLIPVRSYIEQIRSKQVHIPKRSLRYALLNFRDQPRIVLWKHEDHKSVKRRIAAYKDSIVWIRSGYMEYNAKKQTLHFTRTTADEIDNLRFDPAELEAAFLVAFKVEIDGPADSSRCRCKNIIFETRQHRFEYNPQKLLQPLN